jgi:hypothetical protein
MQMADQAGANGKPFDPMEPLRQMRDSYLDTWAKAMIDAVNTDAYAKATGAMLDTYLSVSSPFREMLEKAMLQALQQLSMPSRADVLSLAERFTNMEMRLDDVDAKLDRIEKAIAKPPGAKPASSPARSRRARARKGVK